MAYIPKDNGMGSLGTNIMAQASEKFQPMKKYLYIGGGVMSIYLFYATWGAFNHLLKDTSRYKLKVSLARKGD